MNKICAQQKIWQIIVPPSSPEFSSETGAVSFSGGYVTIALASMLLSNRSAISCKLVRVRGILRLVIWFQLKKKNERKDISSSGSGLA